MSNLREYFEQANGFGVLATANFDGKVDAAIYERPNFIDDDTIAFIMPDHLSHRDLDSNPHAAYLFLESGGRTKGKRLYLTRIKEERDSETICRLLEEKHYVVPGGPENRPLFLVYFHIDRTRQLIEEGERP
ncbi:MAG: pyridoxamine 5'-phosphate oxidase family protein [Syntrophorhabdales bacterium]|jgi:hypothetical protein